MTPPRIRRAGGQPQHVGHDPLTLSATVAPCAGPSSSVLAMLRRQPVRQGDTRPEYLDSTPSPAENSRPVLALARCVFTLVDKARSSGTGGSTLAETN